MLYLKLFHGRNDLTQEMDDWGFDGPVFGPYDFIHTTYACHVKMGHNDALRIVEDMIFYDGKYYGDWSVYAEPEEFLLERFDSSKAEVPFIKKRQAKIIVYVKGGVCQGVKTNISEGCWDYAIVDFDNDPDLPDDYVPFSDEEIKLF